MGLRVRASALGIRVRGQGLGSPKQKTKPYKRVTGT